jgi:DtxR family Mn-dependent transcriptional regulator
MSESLENRNIEEYLEALYVLTRNGKRAANTEISRRLKIAPASVTEMLKKLAEKGYVKYSPYQGATLTDKGLKVGEKMTRKHRLLERFLSDALKIDRDKIHMEACEMEHTLSDEAEESLCRFLKHPNECPDDGKIIPPCDLPFSSCEECIELHRRGLEEVGKRTQNLTSISNLKEGDLGKISFIRGEHKVLQRLLDMGLTPGISISVVKFAPLNGPIEIAVRGSKLALGQDIASNVFVEVT